MVRVFIPPTMRSLTAMEPNVEVTAGTVGAVIDAVDRQFTGFRERVVVGDRLRPGIAVTINGTVGTLGLRQVVPEDAEIHFLPALAGG